MTAREQLQEKREDILRIAAEHGASHIRIFGSVARGDDTPESDIDFLVDMEKGRSLLDLAGLWNDLEDLLHRSIDVATVPGLRDRIRDSVLKEATPL
jgi:predicted nucleotidyltransferase